jgi:hypothetical protein
METLEQEECNILEALHENDIVLGNGICDPELNIKSCNFDNGDCAEFNSSFPQCSVPIPSKVGNGICDDFFPYNSKLCGYDGGDCILPDSNENNDSLIAALSLIVSIAILCLIFARKYHKRRIQDVSDVSLSHSRHSIAIEDAQNVREREMERKKLVIAKILIAEVNCNLVQDKETEPESCALDSSEGEERTCPICYQCFITGEEIVKSLNKHCIHEYHKDCVLPWLLKSDECPMCRASFLDVKSEEDV